MWQASDWPTWRFDLAAPAKTLAEASRTQGLLIRQPADVGMVLCD
ncbi:DUF4172 domain-containing protein [Acidovorax temperans]